jgi:cytochrome c oxidase assembly factor CtaG/putative copper export protein
VSTPTRRHLHGAPLVATAAALVGTAVAAAAATGGLTVVGGTGLPDPGAVTRVGLPVVQAVRDLAMALTVGALVLALTCVPGPLRDGDSRDLGPARGRLVAIASTMAAAWAAGNLLLAALVYSDASGRAWSAPGFWTEAWFFTWRYPLGQYLLWGAALATVVSAGAHLLRSTSGLGLLSVTALAALWPAALSGHAAGTLDHDDAVTFQAMHLLGLTVWFGGLLCLVLVRRHLGTGLTVTVLRYSRLAGVAFALVGVSGFLGAWLRVPRVADLASTYGVLLGFKVAALVALGTAGWWQRRRLLPRLDTSRRAFTRLAVAETLLLATAAGLGVALGRTVPPPPPGAAEPLSPAQSLLGRDLPGPLDAAAWFTAWDLDYFWAPIAVLAIGAYVGGVVRLHRRGDAWSRGRLLLWCAGWVLLLWATSGAPGVYGRVLFSMHMVQHMTIATAVPTFLVLGAPVSLALRTLTRRDDGSAGPRELLQRTMTSVPVQVLAHPVVAAGSFVVSMVVFYYSSAFETSLESHTAHLVMTAHFLVSGYLFAESVVGTDPGIARPPYPLRALLLMVTFGFHALFAVSLMSSSTVLAARWFDALGRTWGPSALADQEVGAGLGWALGEYPLLVMAVALLASWVQADARERRRIDRQADRDGGRELAAYNERLQRMAGRTAPSTMVPRTTGTASSTSSPSTAQPEEGTTR